MVNDPDHEEEMISAFGTHYIHLRAIKIGIGGVGPTETVITIKTPTIEYRIFVDQKTCQVVQPFSPLTQELQQE